MNFNKTFFLGLVGGALLTLGLGIAIQAAGPSRPGEILAEVGGKKLTRQELQKAARQNWIPVENDEYRLLEQGVGEWLTQELFEKEAKAQNLTVDQLYQKEIWGRVQVSSADTLEHYNKNRELYNEPFETISSQISQELRRNRYAKVKEEYLAGLEKKYQAKVHLKKPDSYVEGLALPSFEKGPLPGSPAEAKSELGAPPSLGPAGAKITITEFADYHCGFCKRVEPTIEQIIKKYPTQVRLVFRHYPLSDTPGQGSFLTHEAAVCAQEQGKFWEFHNGIFHLPGSPQPSDLKAIAQKVGLDGTKFDECLKSGRHQKFLQDEKKEGSGKGVDGTPTFFVNDKVVAGAYPYEHFVQVIEGILDPTKAVAPSAPPPPAPPAVVHFDDLEGRPSLGPKNAPVTLVEFSDFQCPFCKRVTPALEEIMKNYSGKVRRVWRHYPLSFHQDADRMAQASECAHEQGKFWEYHDQLFETQTGPHDNAALIGLADKVGLNKKKFESCLTGGKYKEAVQKETAKGEQSGVRGTPAVFVNGKLVSGAKPYEEFEKIVKAELAKA